MVAPAPLRTTREDVLGHRVRVQQLDGGPGAGADVLDLGVQDTGGDGARWALAQRGLAAPDPVLVWTLRGAPHLYRREDLPSVAAAVQPFSDADACSRVHDASRPWKQCGLGGLEALDAVARVMREVVDVPRPKGQVSSELTARLPGPYLRHCRPCGSTHVYEMPFRLAALRAGLELQPGTSPPVLEPVRGLVPLPAPLPRHDVVRGYLHLLGPARPQHVAAFLDAPVKEVQARWPQDAVEVSLDGERRWMLEEDLHLLGPAPEAVRLLGPYDLFLQAVGDRSLQVQDRQRARALWPALGRPGAVLSRGEVVGTWRPRQRGSRLRLQLDLWDRVDRDALHEQAEQLAALRGVRLDEVADASWSAA